MTTILDNILDSGTYRPEVQEQLQLELRNIKEGKLHDALLVKAIAQNWTPSYFLEVARHRGKSWSFMSALSDASLEIEGMGMLRLMTQIVGDNLLITAVQKSMATILRLQALAKTHKGNPRILAIIDNAMDRAQETPEIIINGYWQDVSRIRG